MAQRDSFEFEDDAKEKVTLLIEHRLPWLTLGLVGGVAATFISSRFETLLSQNIQIAFFIPVIVYMADAVGTQTETVYVRNLGKKGVTFMSYFFKELLLGLSVGALFGLATGIFSYLWFHSFSTSLTVGLAMFFTITSAPIIALTVPTLLKKEHKDPSVGAGPFTTVVQDLLSISIYLAIASFVILR